MRSERKYMEEFMLEALLEAKKAYDEDEVPIGCVVVYQGKIIARSHNTKVSDNNSLCHAEMKALNEAQKTRGTKYLYDAEMYVTLEPCAMCAGAIVNCRLGKLYYALEEPKTGCCGSKYNLVDGKFNHTAIVEKGMNREESLRLMQSFFAKKRGNE